MVDQLRQLWQVSIRRACAVLQAERSSYHYKSRRADQAGLKKRIKEIAETRVRYGCRRITVLLRREGWLVSAKRVQRHYREMSLQLRNKTPKRRVKAKLREDRRPVEARNEVWAMDFLHDQLYDGRSLSRALWIWWEHEPDIASAFGRQGMSRAAAHLRTLSCLGLPPEAALVELAPLLREIVSADQVRIGLLDEDDMPIMGYAEHPDFMPLFFKTFDWVLADPTSPAHIFMETHRRQRVGGMVGQQNAAYFETAYHQEFERQLDSHWLLEGAIPYGRRNVGSFNLTRRRLAKPFTAEDVRALKRIQPWLSHALAPRVAGAIADESSATAFAITPHLRASLILDWDLRCLHRTDNAQQLLYILDRTTDNWRTQPRRDGVLPDIVRRVAASLRMSARADAEEAAPPLRRCDTTWGRVVVEASWLRPDLNLDPACCAQAAVEGHLILVQLELRRHARAHAASVLRRAGATPLQVQVGVEILSGVSKPDIADRLGVKRSTVEDASRKVYARVGAHSAADLATICWHE